MMHIGCAVPYALVHVVLDNILCALRVRCVCILLLLANFSESSHSVLNSHN
jgi:hypothetical protein